MNETTVKIEVENNDDVASPLAMIIAQMYRPGFFADHRSLICVPYCANYGAVSGWVICLEGTPPKGTIILHGDFKSDDSPSTIAFVDQDRSKSVRARWEVRIVWAFWKVYLAKYSITEAPTIRVKPKGNWLGGRLDRFSRAVYDNPNAVRYIRK